MGASIDRGCLDVSRACKRVVWTRTFPKEIDIEVVSDDMPPCSAAISTGFRKGRQMTLTFLNVATQAPADENMLCFPAMSASRSQIKDASQKCGDREMCSKELKTLVGEGQFKRAYFVMDKATRQTYILKAPKTLSVDVWSDLQQSQRAIRYASQFNEILMGSKIKFCAPCVVDIIEARGFDDESISFWTGVELLLEVKLDGAYGKFANLSANRQHYKLPQAFLHYSYHSSRGSEIVCDLQGVDKSGIFLSEFHLTDPMVVMDSCQARICYDCLHARSYGCNQYCSCFR